MLTNRIGADGEKDSEGPDGPKGLYLCCTNLPLNSLSITRISATYSIIFNCVGSGFHLQNGPFSKDPINLQC